jgi:hypothetical protein
MLSEYDSNAVVLTGKEAIFNGDQAIIGGEVWKPVE